MKPMTGRSKQQQMGDVSNLITDMTIKGASPDELARAVRHSMVVIDAEKHNLNYRQSYKDNGIASLKEKYQGRGPSGRLSGASTLISKAGAQVRIPARKPRPASRGGAVDPITGKKVYEPTGETYPRSKTSKRTGITTTTPVTKMIRSKRLSETPDARTLSSGTPMEHIYAAHSNSLKALARQARVESLRTSGIKYSPSASKAYAPEVAKLTADLNRALKNRPLERQAQLLANAMVSARVRDNPGMEPDDLKKIKGQSLNIARSRVGAGKAKIVITDREWKAIQAGAISTNRLTKILDNADLDQVKALATPRVATVMTPAKMVIARARLASGYTQAEIADSLGIPVSTLNSALRSEGG
jgi:hypothetical protein